MATDSEEYEIEKFEVGTNKLTEAKFSGISVKDSSKEEVEERDVSFCFPALFGLNLYYMYYCRFHEQSDVYNRFGELMETRLQKVKSLRPVFSVCFRIIEGASPNK